MEHKTLITLAYEYALKTYKNKSFTFRQIWEELAKKAKLDKNERELVGQFYIDLLEDPRFIFIGGKKWRIREFLTSTEIDNYANSLYDFGESTDGALLDKDVNFTSSDQSWLDNEMFYNEDDLKAEYEQYQKTHKLSSELLNEEEDGDSQSDYEDEQEDGESE